MIFFCLFLFSAFNLSFASEYPLVLRAERSLPSGTEQVALTIKSAEGEADLTSNSNFLEPATNVVRIGRFKSPLTDELKQIHEELLQIQNRIHPQEFLKDSLKPTSNPHRVRIWLGSVELKSESPFWNAAHVILSRITKLPDWNQADALTVRMLDQKVSAKNNQGKILTPACTSETKKITRCLIPGYGSAYLTNFASQPSQ